MPEASFPPLGKFSFRVERETIVLNPSDPDPHHRRPLINKKWQNIVSKI